MCGRSRCASQCFPLSGKYPLLRVMDSHQNAVLPSRVMPDVLQTPTRKCISAPVFFSPCSSTTSRGTGTTNWLYCLPSSIIVR